MFDFIYKLCTETHIFKFKEKGFKDPIETILPILLKNLLPKITSSPKFNTSEVSTYFFCLILKLILHDFHTLLQNDPETQNLCQK